MVERLCLLMDGTRLLLEGCEAHFRRLILDHVVHEITQDAHARLHNVLDEADLGLWDHDAAPVTERAKGEPELALLIPLQKKLFQDMVRQFLVNSPRFPGMTDIRTMEDETHCRCGGFRI